MESSWKRPGEDLPTSRVREFNLVSEKIGPSLVPGRVFNDPDWRTVFRAGYDGGPYDARSYPSHDLPYGVLSGLLKMPGASVTYSTEGVNPGDYNCLEIRFETPNDIIPEYPQQSRTTFYWGRAMRHIEATDCELTALGSYEQRDQLMQDVADATARAQAEGLTLDDLVKELGLEDEAARRMNAWNEKLKAKDPEFFQKRTEKISEKIRTCDAYKRNLAHPQP